MSEFQINFIDHLSQAQQEEAIFKTLHTVDKWTRWDREHLWADADRSKFLDNGSLIYLGDVVSASREFSSESWSKFRNSMSKFHMGVRYQELLDDPKRFSGLPFYNLLTLPGNAVMGVAAARHVHADFTNVKNDGSEQRHLTEMMLDPCADVMEIYECVEQGFAEYIPDGGSILISVF